MTIEEKAKAYDKVVSKLRDFISQGVNPLITRADVQDFFPELKESDDEKIRKTITAVIGCYDSENSYFKEVSKKKCIAWLEKQGRIIKENLLLPFKEYDKLMESINRQKKEGYEAGYKQGLIDSKSDQKPAEWSKDDEDNLNSAIYYIRREPYRAYDVEPIVEWLRVLKDRVQQEWSEEDEKAIGIIEIALRHPYDMDGKWDREFASNWLKSLRPQNHWKPSELQLKALKNAMDIEMNNEIYIQLAELYNNLKKL